MRESDTKDLTLLGNQGTAYNYEYNPDILETFENQHTENDYFVKFNIPEFTSLCPLTGQPDHATIYISYIPDVRMVESKSLKVYFVSFGNGGGYSEVLANTIMQELILLSVRSFNDGCTQLLFRTA